VATSLNDDLGWPITSIKKKCKNPLLPTHRIVSGSDRPSRDSTTTVAEGRTSLRHSITSQIPRARNPTELSNSVDPVLNLDPLHPTHLWNLPAEKPGARTRNTSSSTTRFDGHDKNPYCEMDAQRIQEEGLPIALAYSPLGRIVLDA